MIIIFHCYGGTHTSVVAASIHLNLLPRDRTPTVEEFTRLPYFDRVDNRAGGCLHYLGRNLAGDAVFTLSGRSGGAELEKILLSLLEIMGVPREAVAFINCLPHVNLPVRIGGFLSRRLGLAALGRPLLSLGLKMRYPSLVREVKRLERQLAPKKG